MEEKKVTHFDELLSICVCVCVKLTGNMQLMVWFVDKITFSGALKIQWKLMRGTDWLEWLTKTRRRRRIGELRGICNQQGGISDGIGDGKEWGW